MAAPGARPEDAATIGPVGDDTLWTVANKVNQRGHLGTTAQVGWALYRANPAAFDGAPGKIHHNATLTLPARADVLSVNNAEAYARLTGKAPVAVAALPAPAKVTTSQPRAPAEKSVPVPASVPAPKPFAPPARRVDPHAVPVIEGVQPGAMAGARQNLRIIGANFRPGARVDLHDMLGGSTLAGQVPSRIAEGRIDLAAAVGLVQSNWLASVRNADGTKSDAFGFAAGPGAAGTGLTESAAESAARAAAEAEAKAAAEQAERDRLAAEQRRAEQRAAAEKAAATVETAKAPVVEEKKADRAEMEAAAKAWARKPEAGQAPVAAAAPAVPAKAAEPAVLPTSAPAAATPAELAPAPAPKASPVVKPATAAQPAAASSVVLKPSVKVDPAAAQKEAAARAAADKAALDAEFERQFAAERAAYEKKEAEAAARKK